MKLLITLILTGVAYLYGHFLGAKEGYREALESAYDLRNVKEELDAACAALWIGEQNKKYWKKEQTNG